MKTSKKHEITQINSNLQWKITGQLRFFILQAISPEVVLCSLQLIYVKKLTDFKMPQVFQVIQRIFKTGNQFCKHDSDAFKT